MRVTKYEHAFLAIESKGRLLLIDPGMYSEALPKLSAVDAVVYTHSHDDHSFLPHARELVKKNPGLKIFSTSEVAAKFEGIPVTTVYHGDRIEVSNFTLDFFGDLHQEIHRSIPLVENVGVLVNSKLYYPGDSYTPCEYTYEVLACPSAAPWMRISDLIDFLELTRPKLAFATHNAILSDFGHQLQNNRIAQVVEKHGGRFQFLTPGESMDV